MTKSEKIQDSVKEITEAHWSFLREFVETIVYESEHITMTDEQMEGFQEELSNIAYGFSLAFPHGYKHGVEDKNGLQ